MFAWNRIWTGAPIAGAFLCAREIAVSLDDGAQASELTWLSEGAAVKVSASVDQRQLIGMSNGAFLIVAGGAFLKLLNQDGECLFTFKSDLGFFEKFATYGPCLWLMTDLEVFQFDCVQASLTVDRRVLSDLSETILRHGDNIFVKYDDGTEIDLATLRAERVFG